MDVLLSYESNQVSLRSDYDKLIGQMRAELNVVANMQGDNHVVRIEDCQIVRNSNGIGYTVYIRMELLQKMDAYIFVDANGEYKLGDFGVVRQAANQFRRLQLVNGIKFSLHKKCCRVNATA